MAVEESRSSSQRLAVAEDLDPIPEFMMQRAEQAGFHVPYARRFAAAQRGLRLKREAGSLDDVHTRSTNERDFP